MFINNTYILEFMLSYYASHIKFQLHIFWLFVSKLNSRVDCFRFLIINRMYRSVPSCNVTTHLIRHLNKNVSLIINLIF